MALCCVCRSPIRGVVATAPNGKRAHWGCARWAAQDSLLRGQLPQSWQSCPETPPAAPEEDCQEAHRAASSLAEEEESIGSPVLSAAPEPVLVATELAWLQPWLRSLHLQPKLEQALAWCESMGASELSEVLENWEDFADFLELNAEERASLSGSASSSARGGDSSGDACGGEGWLESMQGPAQHAALPSRAREEATSFGPAESPYLLCEQLGRGANAVVYRCSRNGQDFAVKVINLEKLRMRPNFDRLLQVLDRETSILWTLRHERIVHLHDVVRTHQRLYLVMDLVQGGELMDHIMSKGRLREEEARSAFVQIVAGLQYIHGKNIVHRDLKPENILIDRASSRNGPLEVRLSDFGHSKLINDGYTCAHTVVGTPQYWAPEAVAAHLAGPRGYDERADLWSLGVVLYVMLEGAYPFESSHAASTASFQFNGSEEAERLVRGLIRVEPAERLTLEQCLESAWVAGRPAELAKALTSREGEQQVLIPLPRAPMDLLQFRADLAAFSNEHQVPATLRLLEVFISFRADAPKEAVQRGRRAAERLVEKHFPECTVPATPDRREERCEDPSALLAEERESLEAIYGEEFEVLDDAEWRLALGGGVCLRIHLPPGYPQDRPPEMRLEGMAADQGTALVAGLLENWAPGEICVYQWMERLRESLAALNASKPDAEVSPAAGSSAEKAAGGEGDYTYQCNFKAPGKGPKTVKAGQRMRRFGAESGDPSHAVELVHGEPMEVRKSTFQAHSACVNCMEQINWAHRQLLSEKKIASATHNCIAYRYHDHNGVVVSDHDDDNEAGAGQFLESLLKWCGSQGVFVMVTRWYGGVELGPERFRLIKKAAQRLLEQQGLLKEQHTQKKGPVARKKDVK